MIWTLKNYKDEIITWYSEDVIERILQVCKENSANILAIKIVKIIESEGEIGQS